RAGICGTDRHIYEWDEWSQRRIPIGIVLGHEFVGVVEKIGANVKSVKPGQRVSGEGHITAGDDYLSRIGEAHIAREMKVIGIDRDGCFADFLMMPAENLWPIADQIPDRHAAILDPLGNAVHTVMEANVSARSALVMGVGIIGLMAVTVAKAAGAARVFAVDVDDRRLEIARELGADDVFNAKQGDAWIETVRKATRGEGVDALLEMSGAAPAVDAGFRALRNGGTAAMLGTPAKPMTFDLAKHIIFKGATVKGITGRRMYETWYQMEDLLLSGKMNLDAVITHELPLEDYEEGFRLMQTGDAIKVILNINA
ncbi:MAG: L-threonine 3-dehydrogenase, partial [Planctomycetota bacterium]|nr:L-threonine 3-dehydrogenase [Planctomycetota bacterium]